MILDALIVGAGPAGNLLAYHLAKAGLKVQLCEKKVLPRYKACGGGVSRKALQQIPFDVSPVIEFPASGGVVSYQGKPMLTTFTETPFASLVNRDQFDHFLCQKAISAGATLLENCKITGHTALPDSVEVQTTRRNFRTRLLIGADGVNSRVAKSAQLMANRPSGIALEAEIQVSAKVLGAQGAFATFDFGAIPHGYGWVFPKRDHFSVGIFGAHTRTIPKIKDILLNYLAAQPALGDYQMMSLYGHRIPLGGTPQPLHNASTLLVGDAANLADAFLGEGIYYALWSANLAADEILKQWDTPRLNLESYTQQVNATILPHLQYARKIADLIYPFSRLSTHLLKKSAYLQKMVFGVISGESTYQQLWQAITTRSPKILWDVLRYGGKSE